MILQCFVCGIVLPAVFMVVPQGGKPLTNDDIISMVKQGMGDAAIIRVIQTSETVFSLDMGERARFNQAGVSKDVLDAILEADARMRRNISSYPEAISRPMPAYTEAARAVRAEGVLIVSAVVRRDGTLDSLRIARGLGYGLDESAVSTISSRWRFKPALDLKGAPLDCPVNIEVTFRLTGAPKPIVLYDNYGPRLPAGRVDVGFQNGERWAQAIGFRTQNGGRAGKYIIAVSRVSGGDQLNGELRSDSNGRPGRIIDRFIFAVPSGSGPMFVEAVSPGTPMIEPGTQYWLVMTAPDPKREAFIWHSSDSMPQTVHAQAHDPEGPWTIDNAQAALALRILSAGGLQK